MAYLNKVKDMLPQFDKYTIQHVAWDQDSNADGLAKLASARDANFSNKVPVEYLSSPSIQSEEVIQAIDT